MNKNSALRGWLLPVLIAVLCAGLAGCAGGPPKPDKARMTVAARADVNPDASGRASPIVVRVFQLKSDGAFGAADFFALFDDEKKALGPDILSREEFELSPGEQRTIDFAVSGEAHFIGAIAAFRDIRNSTWRVLQPAPKKGIKNLVKKDALTVNVEKSRVTLTIAD